MLSSPVAGIADALRRLGAGSIAAIARLGYAARFAVAVGRESPTAFARLHLTIREIYFAGVLSLIIIAVSGMFVGMVLALQGYDVLQRYRSDESLGVLVALSLVRELGPVVSGLLFASRAGSAITAEIGLMKATEQLSAMEMMGSIRSRASSRRGSGEASSRCRCSPRSFRRWASSAPTSSACG